MKLNDLSLGILVLLCGGGIYLSALQFSPIPGQSYGAETMPTTIALVAIGLGIFMIGKAVVARSGQPALALADWARSPVALLGLSVALGLVLFYILFSRAIGFVPTAFLVIVTLMLTLRTRPVTAIVVSLLATIVIQQAFGRLLLVPLPRSALGFLW
ncbi:tripartite tricarboxylate transporter TctB family protein [Aurantimonas sp. A2-1-M11]|uniref:tripartite tricarboxylate transporter TctB family protein n=1 Tax=Aurantimonas sp. A2-1-M11 TaxID=3113712 RepID=UPI002F94D815